MPRSTVSYAEAWQVHKRRDRQFWGAVLAWPLITFGGGGLVGWALNAESAIPLVGALWIIAMVIFAERNRDFPCPRCGHKFYGAKYRRGWGHVRQCVHCGLAKWADSDPPAP